MTRAEPTRRGRSVARLALPTVLLGAFLVPAAPAHEGAHGPAGAAAPEHRAVRATGEISLDGRLDEADWSRALRDGGFLQREPEPLAPASERTELAVLLGDDTLYIGIRAHDSTPDGLVAGEMGRDVPLFRDDSVVVLLDTFHDHRNAYFFETNPNASRTDALISDEGRDMNLDWDGVWRVATSIDPGGWSAEMAIPFDSLRFDPASDTWGMNVRRLIRRKEETAFWAPIDLDADLFRMSRAGHLVGVGGIAPTRLLDGALDVEPFATGSALGGSEGTDAGLDVKWGLARGLSLDATVNTDFAQTEVDEQRVNLSRFSLFFPEKRQFFLENAGIFEFGPGVVSGGDSPLFKPFFSRRIGIARDGRQVPLDWGLRLAGRVGRWSVGLLDVQTGGIGGQRGTGQTIPSTNWSVVRLTRNLGRRSNAGMIATGRHASGDDFNRLLGFDLDLHPTDRWTVWSFGAATEGSEPETSPDAEGRGAEWAAGLGAQWANDTWSWGGRVVEIGEGFEPEAGFLRRRGFRQASSGFEWQPRPRATGEDGRLLDAVRNFNLGAGGTVFVDRATGRTETVSTGATLFGARLESGELFDLFVEHREERLDERFEIHPGVALAPEVYRWNQAGLFARTSDRRRLSGSLLLLAGELFSGERLTTELAVAWRASRFLRTETEWSRNDVELPEGAFTTDVVRQRVRVAFTPDLATTGLVQWNGAAELLAAHLRLEWRYRPGSELFLVYDETWDAPGGIGDLRARDRRLVAKVTYLFRL